MVNYSTFNSLCKKTRGYKYRYSFIIPFVEIIYTVYENFITPDIRSIDNFLK